MRPYSGYGISENRLQRVYDHLCRVSEGKELRLSIRGMAERTGMGDSTFGHALTVLVERGLIERVGNRRGATLVIAATGKSIPPYEEPGRDGVPFPLPYADPDEAMKGVTFEDDPRAVLAGTNGRRLGNAMPAHVATQSALADA